MASDVLATVASPSSDDNATNHAYVSAAVKGQWKGIPCKPVG